ncbi:MAG: hypothetical protein EOM23_03660 [Candidatus Moranbacteria bacterium]|nr:hypothetical protein [Candidatus Moranbacteria bacterium]
MKKISILMTMAVFIIGGAIFYSCQKEDISEKVNLKSVAVLPDCELDCIDLTADPIVYFPVADQVTVQWGGRAGTDNTKIVDLK